MLAPHLLRSALVLVNTRVDRVRGELQWVHCWATSRPAKNRPPASAQLSGSDGGFAGARHTNNCIPISGKILLV